MPSSARSINANDFMVCVDDLCTFIRPIILKRGTVYRCFNAIGGYVSVRQVVNPNRHDSFAGTRFKVVPALLTVGG